MFSLISASCLLWLERLQPLFAFMAVGGLAYQAWMIWRRPSSMRTPTILVIFFLSLGVNLFVFGTWVYLRFRYA